MHTDYITTIILDKSLIAAVTGACLIITVLRSIPSENISDVDLPIVVLRFHDSNFASRYNRIGFIFAKTLVYNLNFSWIYV